MCGSGRWTGAGRLPGPPILAVTVPARNCGDFRATTKVAADGVVPASVQVPSSQEMNFTLAATIQPIFRGGFALPGTGQLCVIPTTPWTRMRHLSSTVRVVHHRARV